jgi:HD-GYP domain-containing protein (c-di-GMP phosphodiesterase class II)
MSSAFIADTERSLLLLKIKELEEHHATFRDSVICAFNQLLDLKDLSTGVHSTRLAEWAIRVARKLNVPEHCLYQVEVAALLHDVGKIGVPTPFSRRPLR